MKKLILITLLLVPIASWGEASKKTQDLLWYPKVTPMTLGLLHCMQYATEMGLNDCGYSYKRDKFYIAHFSSKLFDVKDNSLDNVRTACLGEISRTFKVPPGSRIASLDLTGILSFPPVYLNIFDGFFHHGLNPADNPDNNKEVSEHIKNNLEIIVGLSSNPIGQNEFYICTFQAKDREPRKSMSIKYLTTEEYFELLN